MFRAIWGMMASIVDTFTEAYTAASGSTVAHLPDGGIIGNGHFMFQNLNDGVVAEHVENWMRENL